MISKVPHILTLLNLLSGCTATVFAMQSELEWAALFVFVGIFFDFFDGLAARMLNAQSELGLQLDSLADMITSGLVPGVVMFQLLTLSQAGGWNVVSWQEFQFGNGSPEMISLFPFAGFLITLGIGLQVSQVPIPMRTS